MTTDLEQSDRLKQIAPDISGFCQDLEDVHHLLGMMTELLSQDDDLDQETIAKALALWRSALPLLAQAHSELHSIDKFQIKAIKNGSNHLAKTIAFDSGSQACPSVKNQ